MFIILPSKSCGISRNDNHPARHINCAPPDLQIRKTSRLHSSTEKSFDRPPPSHGRPAFVARSIALIPGRDATTTSILALSDLSPILSTMFCSVVPDALTRTASLIGASSIIEAPLPQRHRVPTDQEIRRPIPR